MNRNKMKMVKIIMCFIVFFNIYAHGQKKSPVPIIRKESAGNAIHFIDAAAAYKEKKTLGISTIADDIEYIPLETTDDCLLDGSLQNVVITTTDILVYDYNKGYRFNRSGKFLNSIGNKGQGPGEYVKSMNMQVDTINRFVYFVDEERILKYNYEGKHIETIQTGINSSAFLLAEPGQLIIEYSYYQFAKPNERFCVYFFSEREKKAISRFASENKKDKINGMILCDPDVYTYDNEVYIRDFWSDTIYRMNGLFNAIPYAIINKGAFRSRSLPNTQITTGKDSSEERVVLEFGRMGESSRFILMTSNKGPVVFDKKTKTTFMGDFMPEERLSFYDDLYGGVGIISHVFANGVRGDEIHTYGHPSNFSLDKNHLITDSRYEKYTNMIKETNHEDNQIIMIVKLKKIN